MWNERPTRGDYILLWAAMMLCFHGFFRSGELTVPSGKSFDTNVHFSWGDVAINDTRVPQVVIVWLRRAKTNQFGNGAGIVVGRTEDDLCPVAVFIVKRGKAPGAFFVFPNSMPLTKAKFIEITRNVVGELHVGLPKEHFASYSLSIGAATCIAAARARLEDALIMTLGRWSSAAFLRCKRTTTAALAAATARLSTLSAD